MDLLADVTLWSRYTGLIVTHHRPTLYSPSSRTALAEAELEYREDHVSRSVYVSFPVAQLGAQLERELEVAGMPVKEDEKVSLAVWTTTAWTIPSNVVCAIHSALIGWHADRPASQAIAVSDSMEYTLARRVDSPTDLLIVASDRLSFLTELLSTSLEPLAHFRGSSLLATTYTDPLASSSSASASASSPATRPLIPASYVTSTTGTGLVHTAPAHGVEDWEAWRAYQLAQRSASPSSSAASLPDTLCAVDAAGRLDGPTLREMGAQEDVVERLAGKDILKDGTGEVIRLLEERGRLLQEVEVQHKFPYDWRTKKPVIYRSVGMLCSLGEE